jgi:hypothetical protein
MATIQDFSLINTKVQQYKKEFNLKSDSSAFTYFALKLILGLQDDEIEDAITDSNLLEELGKSKGHDRGIDALYIDYDDISQRPKVYLFNFKYVSTFKKIKSNFPSGEIDKINGLINDLMNQEEAIRDTINSTLYAKIEEIWEIFDKVNPSFVMCLCSNHSLGLENLEKERFERGINRHSNFEIKYCLIEDLTHLITKQSTQKINAYIKAIDKQLFEKTDGNIRALIVNVDAKDLIRIVLNDESIRNNANVTDYSELKKYDILEDAFEDNVRIYLRQRSRINRNIKKTALSEDNYTFFYFNNGITITCDRFAYPKTGRPPIIELTNIQVVNGSQTIHALYEAFKEDFTRFEQIEILCRIYETKSSALSTKIAEYTNSQNPVKSRDVRSIDIIQQKLEQEFLAKGLYYERKRGQHFNEMKELRIDAEKVGQVLMAFYNEMPTEAKNRKKLIFGERYDEIFTDEITADKVLLPYKLFQKIEESKSRIFNVNVKDMFILYASYYILYIMSKLSQKNSIPLELDNLDKIWELYPKTINILKQILELEEEYRKTNKFSQAAFFNTERPKKIFENRLLD